MPFDRILRVCVITAAMLAGMALLFFLNRWLYNSYRIDAFGFEIGRAITSLLPPALAGLWVFHAGPRSGWWWWLTLPGLVLWVATPIRTGDGWAIDLVFDRLWTDAMLIWRNYQRAPAAAFAHVHIAILMIAAAAVTIGRTFKLSGRSLRDLVRGDGSAATPGGTAELPRARWASRHEIEAAFNHPGGIVLGERTDPRRDTPRFRLERKSSWRRQGKGALITMDPAYGNGHVLVMSQAGHFKTTGIVTPNILHYDGPLLVFDPKCELYARTKQARIDKGFNPVVIDATHGYDPAKLIALLARDHPSAWLRMARLMIPDDYASGVANGKYFKDAATALFAAMLAAFANSGSHSIIGNIAQTLSLPPQQVHRKLQQITRTTKDPFILNRLQDLEEMESRFWYSVKTEITNNLLFAEYPDIQRYWSMDPDSPVLAELTDPETDIFLNIPQHVAEDFPAMLRLMLGSFLVAAQLVEVNEAPRARRLILIDEASRLGNMDILENIRDRGRSIGLHLMMIYQDIGQIEKIWQAAGQRSWRNGCAAVVAGPVSDPKSAQDLSTMLGTRMVRVATEGSSTTTPMLAGPMSGSVSSTANEQVRDIALISPTLISQLPGHAAIIASSGNKPILATKAIWFTRTDMKDRVRSTEAIREELHAFDNQTRLVEQLDALRHPGRSEATNEAENNMPGDTSVPDARETASPVNGDTGTQDSDISASREMPPDPARSRQQAPAAEGRNPPRQEPPGISPGPDACPDWGSDREPVAPDELANIQAASGKGAPGQSGLPRNAPSAPGTGPGTDEPDIRSGPTHPIQLSMALQTSQDMAMAAVASSQPDLFPGKEGETAARGATSRNRITCHEGPGQFGLPDPDIAGRVADWVAAQRRKATSDQGKGGRSADTEGAPDERAEPAEREECNEAEPESETPPRSLSAAAVAAAKTPGTAESGEAETARQDLPDPTAALPTARTRMPPGPAGAAVNTGSCHKSPAARDDPGLPMGKPGFEQRPSPGPAALPRWRHPLRMARVAVRRIRVRWRSPPGNLPPGPDAATGGIIPRPHDMRDAPAPLRLWDLLIWYTGHPADRYAVYAHTRRWRAENPRPWHGPPPPDPEPPDHTALRHRLSPASADIIPGGDAYDPALNAIHLDWTDDKPLTADWQPSKVGPYRGDQPSHLVFEHIRAAAESRPGPRSLVARYADATGTRRDAIHAVDRMLRTLAQTVLVRNLLMSSRPVTDDTLVARFLKAWPQIPRDHARALHGQGTNHPLPLHSWAACLWVDDLDGTPRLFRQPVGRGGVPLGAALSWPLNKETLPWLNPDHSALS